MPNRFLLLVLVSVMTCPLTVSAQYVDEPAPRVVMNLAAHPDDEDGLTMAYYRYAKNAVVHSVIFTRGEGGQNEIGPALYARLGAIRTAETEAAARLLGTQVRFLNFDDFGYSKTAAETFERWGGKDEVTGRLVYLIRKLKPDVLFTNHDTVTVGPRRQHGHHQAVGVSAYRAMALAADPSYRPEQLLEDGVDLWQPHRLFLRLWRGGQDTADVRVPVDTFVPALGRSSMEVAVEAVAEHRSQGFDLFAERFRRDANHFTLLWQSPDAPPLPAGTDDLAANLPPNPHAATSDLAYLIDSGRISAERGLNLAVSDSVAVPGQTVTVSWSGDGVERLALTGAVDVTLTESPASVTIPFDATLTYPAERAQYNRFVSSPPIQAAAYDAEGRLVHARHLAVEIAPAAVLALDEAVNLPREHQARVLLRPGTNRFALAGTVFGDDLPHVNLTVDDPTGRAPLASVTEPLEPRGLGRVAAEITVELPETLAPGTYRVELSTQPAGETVTMDGQVLPPIDLPAGLRVGFVRSYDAATETALRGMGAEVVPLDSLALAEARFDGLHTIVVDIRSYLDRPDLRAHNHRLLDWVHGGGHLVVTYHKTFEWNVEHFEDEEVSATGFAPYPLRLGRERITQADAQVTHLQPRHPLFHHPHSITASDWDGWIQERGLYFPAEYDDHYVELLAMSDPHEQPLRSSTLIAEYGGGTYLYTALGWYRQLGAFVPGAYRVFANIVSLPLTDGRLAHSN